MTLGTLLLAAGFVAALAAAGAAFLAGRKGDRRALSWARRTAFLGLFCAVLSSSLLLGLILTQRYDVAYVYAYTSRELLPFYRLSAFWAGQQGSFLLWLLLSSVLTVLQVRRSGQFEPFVLLSLSLVQGGLAILLLVDNPFRPLGRVEADGYGMNPLLQNPWMVVHPPVLFVGYAGLALPFAYALAGLWRREYDEWMRFALPWTLFGWFFLGLGIFLGACWSYETLGWGGYWGWDLVENSSLLPWLTGTALLHGMLIQQGRRRLRHGNFLLSILTFLLVLYATYLTRSGVLAEISVHSFVGSALSPWMIGLLVGTGAAGVVLLVSRWPDIPRGPVFVDSPTPRERARSDDVAGTVGRGLRTWFSRDFAFLLTILVLLAMAAPVWVGTLVPLGSRVLGNPGAKLDESWYPLTTAPWALLLLFVLSLCPQLGWQGSDWDRLRHLLAWPAAFATLATAAAVLLGASQPSSLPFILLGALVLVSNAVMIVRTVRTGILRLGGYLAHVGLAFLIVGIVSSSMYSRESPPTSLPLGQAKEVLGYRITFVGWQEEPGRKPALRLEVDREGRILVALPQMYVNPQDSSLVSTPYVARFLTHDLYFVAEGYRSEGGAEEVAVAEGDTVQAAGYALTLRGIVSSASEQMAVIQAERHGRQVTISPTLSLAGAAGEAGAAFLPDGSSVLVTEAYLPPPGSLLLWEGKPVIAAPYTVTLRRFDVPGHGLQGGVVQVGAVLEFLGPGSATVVTPTLVVGPEGAESPPADLSPGVVVRLVQISVEQRAAMVQVDGVALSPQAGVLVLRVTPAEVAAGVAQVRLSIKPGMALFWLGGLLLLLGTATAAVRRWREGR